MSQNYDAILIVSFGGPEGTEDVLPFLENVLRGRNVPRARMLAVARHYELFGGVSRSTKRTENSSGRSSASWQLMGLTFPYTGATATGIRCLLTRCSKWLMPASGVRWLS